MQKKVRIFLVDDYPVVLEGLRSFLEKENLFEICGAATNSNEAFKQITKLQPDIAIIDTFLGEQSGFELTKRLIRKQQDLVVLILSLDENVIYAEKAINFGARGCIPKTHSQKKLLEAIKHLSQGQVYFSGEICSSILRQWGKKHKNDLTDRELQVLEMIGLGQSSRDIADSLYLSPSTIDTYKAKLKSKLNLRNSYELTCYAAQRVSKSPNANRRKGYAL